MIQQIKVGDYSIEIVRKNIRNMHLRVYAPDGRIRLSAPWRQDEDTIRRFVSSKLAWIGKHIDEIQSRERVSESEYITGESLWLEGQRYLLNVISGSAFYRIHIRDDIYIDLYMKALTDKIKRGELLSEWYRARLKARIEPLMAKWHKIMGVEVKEWSVKRMKTKWGTCNITAKRIWINLELAKKPERCLEYIIVHELLHLVEKHHNDVFKAHMDRLLPDWRMRKKELGADEQINRLTDEQIKSGEKSKREKGEAVA
jgi:predicted metal-dependent hydrolase